MKQTPGNYTSVRELGRGISGVVWLVHPPGDPDDQIALKKMDLAQSGEEETEAVMKEIELLSTLKHPNVIGYRDHWREPPHLLCVAMELADGGDLDGKWKTAVSTKKLVKERDILGWLAGIANGLHHLHELLIVHRDMKLANVMRCV